MGISPYFLWSAAFLLAMTFAPVRFPDSWTWHAVDVNVCQRNPVRLRTSSTGSIDSNTVSPPLGRTSISLTVSSLEMSRCSRFVRHHMNGSEPVPCGLIRHVLSQTAVASHTDFHVDTSDGRSVSTGLPFGQPLVAADASK